MFEPYRSRPNVSILDLGIMESSESDENIVSESETDGSENRNSSVWQNDDCDNDDSVPRAERYSISSLKKKKQFCYV